jgi:membrane protease YdiL (CAAX protease family)
MSDSSSNLDSPPTLASTYWIESRQPLASLVFIAPLLVAYEVGVLLLGSSYFESAALRNGADVWLRQFLGLIGLGQYFLLPVLTICILLGWHHTTGHSWRVSGKVLWGMAGECLLLTVVLRLLLQLQGLLMQTVAGPIEMSFAKSIEPYFVNLILYLGAGIYEELLFRLILLSLIIWLLKHLGMESTSRVVVAVVLTSLLFAAAHHVGEHGEPLNWFFFSFRVLAGGFFSVLFIYRGFGIAAGTHAGYDILIGLFT